MFLPKVYLNKLYFRSELTRGVREHFGYSVWMSLHRAPIAQAITFIERVQRQHHNNIIALAYALGGVFEKIFLDVMLSEEGFPYPRDNEMVIHKFYDEKQYVYV